MDAFFAGDFAVRGEKVAGEAFSGGHAESESDRSVVEGLEAIAKEVCACCRCGIGKSRTHAVPGEGNPNADLVFVGEAPGADEDAQGRPFVGRAGQLLSNMISAMGLRREDVFICNIVKCRPPDNRDPSPDEIVHCLPFLQRQLELIRPRVIVALGAHAARTLLNNNLPIGRLRGRFHDYYFSPEAAPAKLMPTYHPAYLLRNYSPDNRRSVWEDMQKVMAELGLETPKGK
ncbi:MAG: uracil-DNA glycosylase [Phycisphaerae bacterium]|nr:uracil-DNA glycosylase [Phycisphaerae bacterium]